MVEAIFNFGLKNSGNFIISFERTISKGNVELLTIFGDKIFAEDISIESKKEISIKNISSGIYFLKLSDGDKQYCKKLIVEQN